VTDSHKDQISFSCPTGPAVTACNHHWDNFWVTKHLMTIGHSGRWALSRRIGHSAGALGTQQAHCALSRRIGHSVARNSVALSTWLLGTQSPGPSAAPPINGATKQHPNGLLENLPNNPNPFPPDRFMMFPAAGKR
jgi:hypothetical protein